MSVVKKINFDNLIDFGNDDSSLIIIERKTPKESSSFFKNLLNNPFNLNEKISKVRCLENIQDILDKEISDKIKENIFYDVWTRDMAKISTLFCDILGKDSISFSLESSRSCKRYHIDNVPIRLLVTYHGKGTEWLPFSACDYNAYYNGESNDKIVKNSAEKRFIEDWDIAIFKGHQSIGVKNAILHRTPDEALNVPSLIMRLDKPSYLEEVYDNHS